MNEYLPFVMPIIVGLIVVVSLGEMAISGMWLPAYYRYAIPLFRKEYPLPTMPDLAAKIPELEQQLKRSAWRPSIVFRALDGNDIAFRNNFGSRNAMSGLIRLDPSQSRMRISGHIYWTFFLTPLMFMMMVVIFPMSFFVLIFLLAIFVMVFGMQWYQYSKIAAVIVATAVSTEEMPSDFLDSNLPDSEPIIKKPLETVTYESEFDEYKPTKPQSGLNNTELTLIIVLMALVAVGVVAAILLFG